MHKNILTVVGITFLFLGLAINPAIAVNPISSDNEEDCNLCPKISKLQELEKYRELSDRITKLTEMNKEINPDYPYPIICNILLLYINFQLAKLELYKILPDTVQILFMPLFIKNGLLTVAIVILYWAEFECVEFELPEW